MIVCTLGDLTLDVIVRLGGQIATSDTPASIQLGPGGQAANVAAWVAALGVNARLVARTGADDAGELARSRLRTLGVEIAGPVEGQSGTICSLVGEAGERSMASDRGAATGLAPGDLDPAWFACDHLHVSGYALMVEPVRSAAVRGAELAREHAAKVSVDLASWSGMRDSGLEAFSDAVGRLAPDVVFANDEEAGEAGAERVEALWIVSHGPRGCSFGDDIREALPVSEVVDTTGAGDALAAGWIVGGPELALEAAARCVEQVGAMPLTSLQ